MTNWIDLANFGIVCAGLIVAVIGLILTMTSTHMGKVSRRFFMIFFPLLIAYIFSDLISQISLVMLGPDKAMLSRAAVFSESFFSSLLMPMLTRYLLWCAGKDPWKSPFLHGAGALFFCYIMLLAITQFTTVIYYITDDNVYHRGPLYPILLIPPALLMLLNLAALIKLRTDLTLRQRQAFFVYLMIPLICMLIQMCSYGLLLIVIGTSVSTLFMLIFIITDSMEQYVSEREENARAQAGIKVLQMRPHFIYNTMSSIYYLCEQDPKKAMETIENFTNYLRKNFSAIAKDKTIPFKEELEHVRAYLAIEQVRFEDKLFVEFDTPHTNFRIPPLTLQPVIENSVKYGVDPELEPLYVSVQTRATDNGSEIIVVDNGPGFDETGHAADDIREPHIAIGNIRERLFMMCGGSISFTTREGGGTVVRIWIPEK